MDYMQKVLGYMRKAVQDYEMLSDGDSVAVGASGGKDSMTLIYGLYLLKRIIKIDYAITAITADPRFGGKDGDYSSTTELCERLGIPYIIKRTDIGEVVFDIRHESNPCSLCARMRRGALHDAAIEAGCNKIALGHHKDDAVETFVMNLFNEGRLGCFSPKSYLSRKEITMIRPLIYSPEKDIRLAAERSGLKVMKSKCPADGRTSREDTKRFLAERCKTDKGFSDRLFGAMRRAGLNGWKV